MVKFEKNEELNKSFDTLIKQYSADDILREKIISKSREIIKLSKQSIFAFHRGDLSLAENNLEKTNKLILETFSLVEESSLREVGSFRASLEEFIEAISFGFFLKNNKIPTISDLELSFSIPYETYLSGLCDLSGELVRHAVDAATNNNTDLVDFIRLSVDELYGLFLKFSFRGGDLRKKFDSLRHNLSKLNDIMYDVHLRGKL